MILIEAKNIKSSIVASFNGKSVWYEKDLVFSILAALFFLLCFLPFGFVAPVIFLPYVFALQKKCLFACKEKRRLKAREIFFSARRFGRCFCIFITKIFSLLLILPFWSLSFTSQILSECEDLDFKGVVLLSFELTKGNKLKVLQCQIFGLAFLAFSASVSFGIVCLLHLIFGLSLFAQLTIFVLIICLVLFCFILPVCEKWIESLFISARNDRIKDV